MPRILIISDNWPISMPDQGGGFVKALSGAGFEVDVITNDAGIVTSSWDATIGNLILVPRELPRSGGALFALKNALFFDVPANPGNYSELRDRLHMHLQEVLYDAVVINCPPQVYLRLGYWINETFGIPVWMHLAGALNEGGKSGFAGWNHRRLRRKYLAAAKVITAGSDDLLRGVVRQQEQLIFIASMQDDLRFIEPDTGTEIDPKAVLARIVRKKAP